MATFQIKDFASITASMINTMKAVQTKITDFNVGAINRTMLESGAGEIDQLYQQMFNGLLQAIPVSVYNSFSFQALTATAASGQITVNIQSQTTDTLIINGTQITPVAGGPTYSTSADVTIPAGQTVGVVQAVCTSVGSAGNIGADTMMALSPAPSGFTSASNLNAIVNGNDDETPEEQLVRFNAYIQSLQGATEDALVYGAKTSKVTDSSGNVIEQVASAIIVEPYLTDPTKQISNIFCYIHNGVGGTSQNLVSQTQNVINGYTDSTGTRIRGYKAAGVICTVVAATEQPLNVSATLTAAAGYDKPTLVALADTIITAYLQTLAVGDSALFSLLITLVKVIPGVADFVLTAPTANTAAAAANNKIMPGVIAIS